MTLILTLSYPYPFSVPDSDPNPNSNLTPTLSLTLILSDYQTVFEFGLENSKIALRFKEPSGLEVPHLW